MKIAHFVQGYTPAIGGTEYLIQRVSEELVKSYKDEVTVYTTNAFNCEAFNNPKEPLMEAKEEIINGVYVKRFKVFNKLASILNGAQRLSFSLRLPRNDLIRTLYSGPILPGIFKELPKIKADVIAASSFPLLHMHYASLASRFTKTPLVLHGGLHPTDIWGFERKVIYRLIEKCTAYIANTAYERNFLINRGIPPQKIHVIGVGTDPEKFAQASGEQIRAKYSLDGCPVVAFVGQQGGHKGIETLISAMPLVWKKAPEAKLIIAGSRTNYSLVLDKMIKELKGKAKNIIKIDNIDEKLKAEILAACDIFASPSGFESFGITYLEAWSAGKPVIGTRQGAIPTVIDEGKDGLLIDYKDYRELAGAIIELIFDSQLRQQLGENGRLKVLKRYTWPQIAKKFRLVYQRALSTS